ncbi:hypothetical protein PILCRDRAFT_811307 [Piloderma croceum F 1598]|uniref:Uncharacterized protein n=1 Tax=Piloderma croceum (strain F 1598) TaxID=765440 RepID=A0A0C3BW90_PILCF|nr:hypothetical protein PILCRDRAFT_811307 [Piloderma croceum F 1598]
MAACRAHGNSTETQWRGMANNCTIQVSVNPIVYIDHYYLVNGDGLFSATLQT